MNELINWVALNNTLMIRIGFSAVLLLVIAYVFRYFFVPRISVVTQAEEAEAQAAKDLKQDPAIAAEEEQARAEEIEVLKAEIESLKAQVQEIPGTAAAKPAGGAAAAAVKAAEPINENELVVKIQSLEARLSEYEIIAEEIAEIGLLRDENAALKAQLAAKPADTAAPVEAETEPEPEAEAAPAADAKYDGYEILPPPEQEESRLVITSEVEVSEDEQALLNDFEEMIRKKG